MVKIKTNRGYRHIKELGGATRREAPSFTSTWLVDNDHVSGRVLDYGCGYGFDADSFGWEKYDPFYFQQFPSGEFDTIVCSLVLNMLTRASRWDIIFTIQDRLTEQGVAYLSVSRNIPTIGKLGIRRRIQNYVVLDLPSLFCDDKLEIYRMTSACRFADKTEEIERRLE